MSLSKDASYSKTELRPKPEYHKTTRRTIALLNKTKVSKGAKIRYRYNEVPHLTEDTNGKVTNSQLYTTN